jgi:hypothetical protein
VMRTAYVIVLAGTLALIGLPMAVIFSVVP